MQQRRLHCSKERRARSGGRVQHHHYVDTQGIDVGADDGVNHRVQDGSGCVAALPRYSRRSAAANTTAAAVAATPTRPRALRSIPYGCKGGDRHSDARNRSYAASRGRERVETVHG